MVKNLKLGLGLGYWGSGPAQGQQDLIKLAEDLGFDSMWTAEAYGSDAFTPLAWFGKETSKIKFGTGIVQMANRTPTGTAMAAMTLDILSEGRVLLGIGASGPQVVEGWYGQPYPKPLARTREYITVLRQAMAREVVEFHGEQFDFPFKGTNERPAAGLGKALKSTLHPIRPMIPILLAAEGPKNVALAAEIADGWIAMLYSPHSDFYTKALAEGFAAADEPGKQDRFEVVCSCPVRVDDDIERAADTVRPFLALYVGGMGAKGANFHYDAIARLGFEEECAKIQELYLTGRKEEALKAVSLEMVDKIALIGPKERIKDNLEAWRESPVTTLNVSGDPDTLRVIAELVL